MHIRIATAIVLSLAFASQQRGWVSSVTASPNASAGTVQITIRGTNPCGAVTLDFGDGSAPVTHTISNLPATFTHDYPRAGEFRVRARGAANCDGDVFTAANVAARPGSIFGRRSDNNRFADWDQNGDDVITRAEWRGTAQGFDQNDWNNDGRLSGDEVRVGAKPPSTRFAQMDRNNDGIITRAEWIGTVQAFDNADWNNDGRLSGDEVRIGAERRLDFTEAQFRRFDRNRDNYLSGTEWRYEPDDFVQVDSNNDDRVSLNEFLNGDVSMDAPGRGRGRGRGLGRGNNTTPYAVMVNNNQAWVDTGIDVRSGDQLTINATGTVRFSRRVTDTAGPNGAPGHRAPNRAPLPQEEIGALVARVGNSAPFFAGSNRAGVRAPQTGRLYLGINDDNLADNSGEFRVSILVNGRGR